MSAPSEGDAGMPDRPSTMDSELPTPPPYGEASLCNVLPGVVSVLAGGLHEPDPLLLVPALAGVRRVAVLLVDGLGYHLLPAASRHAPVLADVLAGSLGSLGSLISGFPSTTPVSLASLGTGVPPGTHGILGFTTNIPGTDRVLNHVNWRPTRIRCVGSPYRRILSGRAAPEWR